MREELEQVLAAIASKELPPAPAETMTAVSAIYRPASGRLPQG
jgi:hypothetical protein